jgi:hypothetical protein
LSGNTNDVITSSAFLEYSKLQIIIEKTKNNAKNKVWDEKKTMKKIECLKHHKLTRLHRFVQILCEIWFP